MFRRSPAILVFCCIFFLAPIGEAAQVDYFLKIDGIDGESDDRGHPGWLELDSFSWGANSHAGGGGGGAGKVQMQDFHFVMKVNKATPKLMTAMTSGRVFPQVVLEVRGERHLLKNVRIASLNPQPLPTGGEGRRASISFERCETHDAPLSTAAHKHKAENKLQAAGPKPVPIGLLLPAVQKVREAARPQGSLDEILIGLSLPSHGRAAIIVQGGSEAANALQRAFQTQQKLEFLEISRKDQPYIKIKFTDVLISSYQTGGSSGDVIPTDQISLNFSKVDMNRAVRVELKYATMEGNSAGFQDVGGFLK